MDQIEEIKQKVDIVELIQEHVSLKKAGRNFKGLCPFHGEKTPSFMVNPELQIFKCFGCQSGGDAYTFLQKIEGMDFGEALKHLAKRTGVTLESYKPNAGEEQREKLLTINALAADVYHWFLLNKNKVALDYLKNRGITTEAIEKFKLGCAPADWDTLTKFLQHKKKFDLSDLQRVGLTIKTYDRFRNRIMFPLNNQRGQTVGFAGRVLPGSDQAKYVNTSETEIYHKSELLYGLDITRSEIKTKGFAVVVEGEIDCIASWQSGIKNVVAIKGSALTERQVELLRRLCDTVVLALDTDLAGDAAARRGIQIAEKQGLIIKIAVLGDSKDPGDLAISDPDAWKQAIISAIPIYDFYLNSAVKRYGLEIDGKKKIGQELLPILGQIEDEIVKVHYIKLLAKTLDVEEQDIRTQMAKLKQPMTTNDNVVTINDQSASRREMLEEYLVELALKGQKIDDLPELQNSFWKRAGEELKMGKDIKKLSPELREKVEILMLKDEEFSEKEWHKALERWEELNIRETLKESLPSDQTKMMTRLGQLTKGR